MESPRFVFVLYYDPHFLKPGCCVSSGTSGPPPAPAPPVWARRRRSGSPRPPALLVGSPPALAARRTPHPSGPASARRAPRLRPLLQARHRPSSLSGWLRQHRALLPALQACLFAGCNFDVQRGTSGWVSGLCPRSGASSPARPQCGPRRPPPAALSLAHALWPSVSWCGKEAAAAALLIRPS